MDNNERFPKGAFDLPLDTSLHGDGKTAMQELIEWMDEGK